MELRRNDRQVLEVWRLASLANHPGRQQEAREYCVTLVNQHPCNLYAFPWASARGYEIDFKRLNSIAALESQRDPLKLDAALMATGSALQLKDGPAALSLLQSYRAKFEEMGQLETWKYWSALVRVFSGDPKSALTFIRSLEPNLQLLRVEILALRAEAQRTGERGQLLERLSELYTQTANVIFLVEICNEYAASGNWTAVSELSEELLRTAPTADSLYMALIADYNTGRYERCLKRTQDHRDWLTGGVLPLDIRRIRIGCLERLGNVRQALIEAEELQKDDASIEALVGFFRLCMKFGSTQRAIVAAQDLLDRGNMNPADRIAVAEMLIAHAPDLSRELLRSADQTAIPPERITSALRLGYRLELEQELNTLFQRATTTVEGSPILEPVQQEDLLDRIRRKQSSHADLVQAYDRGQIPIHLLADQLQLNLPGIYWHQEEQAFAPLSQPHVMVYHGKRFGVTSTGLPSSTRLSLDVTSVLLAHRFDLWDSLRKAVAELRVGSHLIPFLQETLGGLGGSQPAWIRSQREVLDAWREGLIDTEISNVDLTLDFQPVSGNAPQINLRAVAEHLRSRGVLSSGDYERTLAELSAHGELASSGILPDNARRIHCVGSTITLLAMSGLLRPFATVVTLVVDRSLLDMIEGITKREIQNTLFAGRLKQLIEYLSRELQTEKLRLIPESGQDIAFNTPGARCLADLLLFKPDPEDIVCVDDRFVNGYMRREGEVRLVGLNDVLPTLVERGLITQANAWQVVHRFRRANFWFIPIQASEIVHHVMDGGIGENGLTETSELTVMRRYMAACAARSDLLQRGPGAEGPNDLGEISFLLKSRHAVAEALALMWTETNQSNMARLIRADWILDALYLDITGLRRILGTRELPETERQLSSLDAVLLFIVGLTRIPITGADKEARWEAYADWIWNQLFRRRCRPEPEIVDAVTATLTKLFQGWVRDASSKERSTIGQMTYRIIQRLPEPLRTRFISDDKLLTDLGVTTFRVSTVGDLQFESGSYTAAVVNALHDGSSRVEALNTKEEVIIRRIGRGRWDAIDIERPSLRKAFRLGTRSGDCCCHQTPRGMKPFGKIATCLTLAIESLRT